ncbi:MAG: YgjV family protein [Patescibacteria group bacterium]|jgi:hypothetical protein
MPELSLYFILSQIAVTIAMVFDFLSFQFKKRQATILCFIISASLISTHYFLLGKTAAGVITFLSVVRFITSYFSIKKKYLFLFITLNTLSLFFTYNNTSDFIVYIGSVIFMTGNFHADNKSMRKLMMLGTSIFILYNFIIFSPMAVIMESSFLMSNFIGYYRHYIKTKKI